MTGTLGSVLAPSVPALLALSSAVLCLLAGCGTGTCLYVTVCGFASLDPWGREGCSFSRTLPVKLTSPTQTMQRELKGTHHSPVSASVVCSQPSAPCTVAFDKCLFLIHEGAGERRPGRAASEEPWVRARTRPASALQTWEAQSHLRHGLSLEADRPAVRPDPGSSSFVTNLWLPQLLSWVTGKEIVPAFCASPRRRRE